MADLVFRSVDAGDEAFLWQMLVAAASWRPDGPDLALEEAMRNPAHALYVQDWGRDSDVGVIAERAGVRVGAAWWRFFTPDEHGYGFVEPAIPEVSIAVAAHERGRGVGTALLEQLIGGAIDRGVLALSLSVEVDNPALRLYERLGFVPINQVGNALTLRLETHRH